MKSYVWYLVAFILVLGYFSWRYKNEIDCVIFTYQTNLTQLVKDAENGDSAAQWRLGYFYSTGYRLRKDEAKAFTWYLKAAEQGDVDCQYLVGHYYTYGIGVKQDKEAAAVWFRKAAEQGDPQAKERLEKLE